MAELRAAIDQLDQELIDMLARAPRETVDKWSERRERT